jgi:hypothetical protein
MNTPETPQVGWKQFFVALVLVLASVVLGYLVTRRHEAPRPSNRPTALGHTIPNLEITNVPPQPPSSAPGQRPTGSLTPTPK